MDLPRLVVVLTVKQGYLGVSAVTIQSGNLELTEGILDHSASIGTIRRYKGYDLFVEPNVNIGGTTDMVFLTSRYIVANNTGNLTRNGSTIDAYPFEITGVDTSRLFRGDRVL